VFLTALAQDFPHPERISGDHELRRAEADTPYRAVEYDDELLTWGGVPAWIAASLAALVLPLAVAAGPIRRGRAARGGRAGGSPPRP
jgi:hypothetical protein